ncbi:Bug family tripartite tricarboxylate transporter substrate binding protein [Achromobacter sp. NPDC008082]|uniref:Bug family tripartite tricarboxylate transporter substrate binding protein n=1 Tax=Achromobacter sp. NPDC008082 TaxID=3363888 RepID=UPI0036F03DB6
MLMRQGLMVASLLAAGLTASLPAHAQAADAYPNQPVTLVVPFQPGGGTDAVARTFAKVSAQYFPKGMVVLNKSGAGGAVGWKYVLNSKNDGHTLTVVTAEFVILPLLGLFDHTYKDYTPLVQLNADPAAIVVPANSPYQTLEQFMAAAKKAPATLNVGTSGTGSIYDVALSAFEVKSDTRFTHIPFPGSGPALLNLLGGQLDAVATSPAEASEYVRSGKLRLLVLMSDKRVPEFPDVPTAKEKGLDVAYGTWRGIAGPKGMPPATVTKLKEVFEKVAQDPQLISAIKAQNLGYVYADSDTFEKKMAAETADYAQVLKTLSIK